MFPDLGTALEKLPDYITWRRQLPARQLLALVSDQRRCMVASAAASASACANWLCLCCL